MTILILFLHRLHLVGALFNPPRLIIDLLLQNPNVQRSNLSTSTDFVLLVILTNSRELILAALVKVLRALLKRRAQPAQCFQLGNNVLAEKRKVGRRLRVRFCDLRRGHLLAFQLCAESKGSISAKLALACPLKLPNMVSRYW